MKARSKPHALHASHPQVINRLKRVDGHLQNVIAMLAGGRPCEEIVPQLHAVERAIAAAKKTLIHDHLDHCLADAIDGASADVQQAVAGFRDLTRYL